MRVFALPAADQPLAVLEIETPEPAEGEVRVRVHAASVNGFDLAVAGGMLVGMMEHRFPVVIGKDFAGTVDAVGPGVTDYAVGDRVFGVVTKEYLGDGSFGEYVVVPTAVGLAKLPDALTFEVGATLGLAGTAALQAFESAAPRAGDTVLVAGATGGVGNQVLQHVTRAGATPIATASGDGEIGEVRALGAETTVDWKGDVAAQVAELRPDGVDVLIHLAGDPQAWLPTVAKGGRLVSTLVMSPDQLPSDDVTVIPVYANPSAETLDRLAAFATSGETTVSVQQTFGLDEVAEAFDTFRAGTRGKLVIRLV